MSTGELLDFGGLQGLWRLNGDFTDSSGNGYTLTGLNTPADIQGIFKGAKGFISTSTQAATIADASAPALEIAGSQTWMAWFYPTAVGATERNIMAKAPTAATKNLTINTSSQIVFRIIGLTPDTLTSAAIVKLNKWNFVAGRYNSAAGTLAVFLNGEKAEVAVTGTPTDTDSVFAIGQRGSATDQFFDGRVDEAAVYSRAWTDRDITNYYSWALGRKTFIA